MYIPPVKDQVLLREEGVGGGAKAKLATLPK